ncbi:acyloxyacyl hydrolase [Halomonas kalidii]|uniref:Acyloxyacyl hydrolase n=1 Tax=Halomonas kalidii TaxID=3043293 RepID=A0ABT6VQR1_9GAMM|nr:acyloxyacyl hydrolase [Halomonas kalidii]MDI5935106.1 acyloxyacyl hydrolase [Halomonas kalidii]
MSRRTGRAIVTALAALLGSAPAMADWYVAAGASSESTAALTVEIDRMIGLERFHPRLDLRLATGLLLLSSREKDGNAAWLLSPALRYTFAGQRGLFFEGGIGAALFLDTRVESRELSTAFQFEDRLALGMPWASGELSLALTHYSNGGIRRPNDGFETLTLGYRFSL